VDPHAAAPSRPDAPESSDAAGTAAVAGTAAPLTVGVLALQGAFDAHQRMLEQLGAVTRQVRTPADLAAVDALVMPGGESTTMSRLLDTAGLFDPLAARLAAGMPVFGTCAGMILLADEVLDGRPDQRSFGVIDLSVRRNGYGRQVDSFEADVAVTGLDHTFHVVFIRAPKVERTGDSVEVLASHDGVPVLARHGRVLVASFHPELTSDRRVHAMFLDMVHTSAATAA
jgi:pyridoxal 5'-phosphate synthase pdxT subunit